MAELADILAAANITRALIVDDAIDEIPLADDLSVDSQQWTQFFDDLSADDHNSLDVAFPGYSELEAEELQKSDGFVRCLWDNRKQIAPMLCQTLFARYTADMQADIGHLNVLRELLEASGLTCNLVGRDFVPAVADTDIVFMDLYLCSAQRTDDIKVSIDGLASAIAERKTKPPLVILMSRSNRLEDKRSEFREGTKLFESTFRILVKADIQVDGVVQRILGRLATHYQNSLKLSEFVCAWEDGLDAARDRTTALIRRLGLSDLAQIQYLLLSAEGEPMGSYLVDVFDKVLQHEIEANASIIDTALALNELDTAKFPAPLVPGANDLLEFVEHSLFHNRARLRLPGAIDSSVSFGDVLRRKPAVSVVKAAAGLAEATSPVAADVVVPVVLPEIQGDMVVAVLSPACDLQRNQLKRVLLLAGDLLVLRTEAWSAKNDGAKTPIFDMGDGIRRCIKWDLKHVLTLTHAELSDLLLSDQAAFEKIGRLRDLHALEIQQKLLSSMGRVGLAAPMPATHAVRIEAFTVGTDKKLRSLNIASLADGGVCYIGRNPDGEKPQEKLVLTERACEDICRAIDQIDPDTVHERSKDILKSIQKSSILYETLEHGLIVSNRSSENFIEFKSANSVTQGLVARNKKQIDTLSMTSRDLQHSGLVLIAYDASANVPDSPAEEADLKDAPGDAALQ
ncbi:hypothetical protein GCM10007860_29910 [Chitiniphilus shinanonensis]|uniref:Response receiver domain-containing protein n=1 Tax=Chitiniphilus shinanonensis TaxID=553088 RepID=A0ABQ6BWM9_9NEIS|nr:hypothetical protein [Chitiniphilus shinanonensis]GLS05832.1 hypothetical protein GCM10007860_29910 [Chitiniphilus shinanonensis]